MIQRIETRSGLHGNPHVVFIATLSENTEHLLPGAISHIVGSDRIVITEGKRSILLAGQEKFRLLRDALIKICTIENL